MDQGPGFLDILGARPFWSSNYGDLWSPLRKASHARVMFWRSYPLSQSRNVTSGAKKLWSIWCFGHDHPKSDDTRI